MQTNKIIPTTASFILMLVCTLSLMPNAAHAWFKLGSPETEAPLPFETVYIAPIAQQSFAPGAQALLSQAIRREFITAGTALLNENKADATLEVALINYTRSASAQQQEDTAEAQAFNVKLEVSAKMVNNTSGKTLMQQNFTEDITVYNRATLQAGEFHGMPELTSKLARNIVRALQSSW